MVKPEYHLKLRLVKSDQLDGDHTVQDPNRLEDHDVQRIKSSVGGGSANEGWILQKEIHS